MNPGQAHPLIAVSLSTWSGGKDFIERASAVSPDALHMIVGLALFLLFAAVLRRSAASPLPWLATAALLALNEFLDLAAERWPSLGMQLGESAKDVLVTMSAPTLILITVRVVPSLYDRSRDAVSQPHREADEPDPGQESPVPASGAD